LKRSSTSFLKVGGGGMKIILPLIYKTFFY
jgi:hypothetical protein